MLPVYGAQKTATTEAEYEGVGDCEREAERVMLGVMEMLGVVLRVVDRLRVALGVVDRLRVVLGVMEMLAVIDGVGAALLNAAHAAAYAVTVSVPEQPLAPKHPCLIV